MSTIAIPNAEYSDKFLNALSYSHRVEVKAELYYNNVLVKELPVVTGQVSADRSSTVRRTATVSVDPQLISDVVAGTLTPYGYYIKLYRGVRYIDNTVDLKTVFSGRIDQVDTSIDEVRLTCSDYSADIADAKFESPWTAATRGTKVTAAMTAVIKDVRSTYNVIDNTGKTDTLPSTLNAEQDRVQFLDLMAESIASEWYADMFGNFVISLLPAKPAGTITPTWIVDTGSTGVMVSRQLSTSRTGVYNAVIAPGESLNNTTQWGHWVNDVAHGADPNDPLLYGGPFGKVPLVLDPNATLATPSQADEAAAKAGKALIAAAQAVNITCIPNPLMQLVDIIEVRDTVFGLVGYYFVASMQLPRAPDDVMQITANKVV